MLHAFKKELVRTFVALGWQGMIIPTFLKLMNGFVYAWQEDVMEAVQVHFGSSLSSHSSILNTSEKLLAIHLFTSRQSLSTLSLCTELPVTMHEWSWLWLANIYLQTPTFSPPWSVRTLSGRPNRDTLSWNKLTTVDARLLSEHFRKTTVWENPSMAPCMTNLQRTILWCPSICQTEFGKGTEYIHLLITAQRRKITLAWSTRCIEFGELAELFLSSFWLSALE